MLQADAFAEVLTCVFVTGGVMSYESDNASPMPKPSQDYRTSLMSAWTDERRSALPAVAF